MQVQSSLHKCFVLKALEIVGHGNLFPSVCLCRLTCFVVGQEEPAEGCRINGMKYPPALPGFYGKGVTSTDCLAFQRFCALSIVKSGAWGHTLPIDCLRVELGDTMYLQLIAHHSMASLCQS